MFSAVFYLWCSVRPADSVSEHKYFCIGGMGLLYSGPGYEAIIYGRPFVSKFVMNAFCKKLVTSRDELLASRDNCDTSRDNRDTLRDYCDTSCVDLHTRDNCSDIARWLSYIAR